MCPSAAEDEPPSIPWARRHRSALAALSQTQKTVYFTNTALRVFDILLRAFDAGSVTEA